MYPCVHRMIWMLNIRLRHAMPRPTVTPMSTSENKRLLEAIFAARARGDHAPFRDAMADDFTWTIIGSTPWSGTYRGKRTVLMRVKSGESTKFVALPLGRA